MMKIQSSLGSILLMKITRLFKKWKGRGLMTSGVVSMTELTRDFKGRGRSGIFMIWGTNC
jgi:hypothetical protein